MTDNIECSGESIRYCHDAADALANKFKGNFVNSSNDTFLKVQYIERVSLLSNE